MADPFGLVSIAILIGSCLVLLRHRRDFRITRFLIVLASSILMVLSVIHTSLSVSIAAVIAASEIALFPIVNYDFEDDQKILVKSFLTYQLCSQLFLIFAVLLKSQSSEAILVDAFFVTALCLRIVLPFCGKSLSKISLSIAPWARTLFFLSTFVFTLIVSTQLHSSFAFILALPFALSSVNLYWAESNRERLLFVIQTVFLVPFLLKAILPSNAESISVLLGLIAVLALSQMALSGHRIGTNFRSAPRWFLKAHHFDVAIYKILEAFCLQLSLLSRRFFGPILIESLFIRVVAFLVSILRLSSRVLSYAGLPKLIATSIIVSIFALVYVLKV